MNVKISNETIERLKAVVGELNVPSGNPGIETEVEKVELDVLGVLGRVPKGIAAVGAARALLNVIERPETIRPVRTERLKT